MKRRILALMLILTIILSSFIVSYADSNPIYLNAPFTNLVTPTNTAEIQDVYIFTKNGVNVFFNTGERVGWAITQISNDYVWFKHSAYWGGTVAKTQWCTPSGSYKKLTASDYPLIVTYSDTFPGYNPDYQGMTIDATGLNINDPTPVSAYTNGITFTSPAKMANILDDYINLRFVCKVPITAGGSDNALIAEILGQRMECYVTTNRTGSAKYYLPRHDGLKPHFIESQIIDKNSLFYVVTGVISVPNDSLGVTSTLNIKLPTKVDSILGVTNPTWTTYTATLRTLYNAELPTDIGGSATDTGDPNTPIGDMPDSSDYDRTTITGNLDYWGDTILWFISLPFQALAKAASALTDRVSQATQWIGTQDSGVIGFFNIIFSFLPEEVTGLITVLIILFIVICIYRFMRG